MGTRRAAAGVLLAAALGLAGLGQYYFFRRQAYVWDGVVFHGLAVACFFLAWRQVAPTRETARPRDGGGMIPQPRASVVLLAAGAALAALATLMVRDRMAEQATGDAVVLWLAGIAAAVTAAVWPDPGSGRVVLDPRHWRWLRQISRATWLEMATVAMLTALALLLRAVALDRVPFTLGGDEAWHGLLARQVLHRELRNPFVMGYMSMPTLFYWPISWSLRLAGEGMVGLRLPAAVAGTMTVPFFYVLVRSLWGPRTALLSATFLATYDYHVHYSRLAANNVWDPLFAVVVVWALDRALAEVRAAPAAQRRLLILAGLVMGLAFYFYTGARLLPLLAASYAGFIWVERRWQRSRSSEYRAGNAAPLLPASTPGAPGEIRGRWSLVFVGLAVLVVAGPMIAFALAHPDEWNARVNQIGILQSGWLAREPGLTGKTTAQILAEQFLRAAGAFHVFPDRTAWYGADRPLLGFVAGGFALLGMAWAASRWRERRYFLVLAWFWSVIVTGGMLTESPPSSQRLVMAIPAVCVLVAVGLERLVDLAGRLAGSRPAWEPLALGLLVVVLGVSNIRFYFLDFVPSGRYGTQNGETATMIGHYLRDVTDGTRGPVRAFFFGAPRMYWSFGTMGFLAPDVQAQDVTEPLSGAPIVAAGDSGGTSVFLFLPERAGELQWVQQAYPRGRVREFQDARGQLRFVAYEAAQP